MLSTYSCVLTTGTTSEYDSPKSFNGSVRAITRELSVNLPNGSKDGASAWGVNASGLIDFPNKDRWVINGVYGKGLGRYLLGIQSTAGGAINPVENRLELRDNWGAMTAYLHHWSPHLRSTAMLGHARSDALDWQAGNTFESSTYGSLNLMWQLQPYLTIGVEYNYGKNENKSGEQLDNHRFALGFQFF